MSLSFLLAILLIGHTNVVYLSADPELSDAQIAGAVWDVPAASESMPDIEVEASVESEQLSASDRPSDEDMYSLLENAKFVDSNRDAKLSNEELYEWVKMAYRDKCEDDALRQAEETLRRYDTNRDLRVSWHELAHAHFDSPAELVLDPPADLTAFVNYVAREKLRFELADRDGDQLLTERELAAFLMPDCYNHTVPIIARTLLHRDDYDGDGKLSTYEFQPDTVDVQIGWWNRKEETFKKVDTNGDGFIDLKEFDKAVCQTFEHNNRAGFIQDFI